VSRYVFEHFKNYINECHRDDLEKPVLIKILSSSLSCCFLQTPISTFGHEKKFFFKKEKPDEKGIFSTQSFKIQRAEVKRLK
jgi:hypothetical protein